MISAKPVVIVALLALAGAALVCLLDLHNSAPLRPVKQEGTDLPGGADGAMVSSADAFGAAETDQQATDPATETLQRTPLPAAARTVITGRVVALETGLPLSGCEVVWNRFRWPIWAETKPGEIETRVEIKVQLAELRPQSGQNPASTFSRADGRFELVIDEMVAPLHFVDIKPPNRASRQEASFEVRGPVRIGQTLDLGDLPIALRQDEE